MTSSRVNTIQLTISKALNIQFKLKKNDKINPSHLAVPGSNVEEAKKFYREVLGFKEGRRNESWVDFNMYGLQLVIHHKPTKRFKDQVGKQATVFFKGPCGNALEFKSLR